MDEQQAAEARKRLAILKTQAVSQATIEVLGENRAEIVRRARAKLVAMGVALEQEESGVADGTEI